MKDVEVEVDEDAEARDLRRRAKEVIASATFFFFSKRFSERRVGRSLCKDTDSMRFKYLRTHKRDHHNRNAEDSRANLLYVRI